MDDPVSSKKKVRPKLLPTARLLGRRAPPVGGLSTNGNESDSEMHLLFDQVIPLIEFFNLIMCVIRWYL